MPIVRMPDAPVEDFGESREVFLSDGGGLTQFGAIHVTQGPGEESSIYHWHEAEDEFVYMLSGELTVREGDTRETVRAGEAVCFRAGVEKGHTLVNEGTAPATYLVVGTRAARDRVIYPENDCILHRDREAGSHHWTTLDGKPAGDPYRKE